MASRFLLLASRKSHLPDTLVGGIIFTSSKLNYKAFDEEKYIYKELIDVKFPIHRKMLLFGHLCETSVE